jgi:outer membrane protein assembly factor BamD
LAPIEKAEKAPDAVNEAAPGSQPAAQAPPANGKKPKPTFDKADESSSKHKKKKGLGKLNPF